MKRNKISIVGAGNVGATCAHWAITKNLGDVVLIDIAEGIPQGKALDMAESLPIVGVDLKVTGSNNYSVTKDSDIVIITAGLPRKPGMSRDDLLKTNANIMKSVTKEIAQYSPEAILIIVSNPLDAMAHVALKESGFSRDKVIGMAGILDTARFRSFIAEELNVSVENVHAMVLGGHGDTMVPLLSYTNIAGIPIRTMLSEEKLSALVERTRKGGIEIVNLLKTGSAYYAPSCAAIEMAEAILYDKKKTLPCSVFLKGEYGVTDSFLGVPVILGKNGVEKIIELDLSDEENAALAQSALSVKELIETIS
ncbi:MAG: malate dehydrogenase [Candidatus Ancaeobacter aquaticus]|nr:malate dehydrogenase [Candidatus Ancaeobacter aquaticus]